MNGILNLDKPPDMTSHDAVARIRRAARIKRVGHAGTLDPMATGVLLLCLGQATRLSDLLMGGRKTYRADVTFGAATDTQDSTGTVTLERDASGLSREVVAAALPAFTGEIRQVPPMVSALHHEGKRLYELARQGIEVERAARPVTIYRLELLAFEPGERPVARIETEVSAGTYIRALAHDIGEALGCGAHMSALRRTAVGPFGVADAMTLDAAEEAARNGSLAAALAPMKAALKGRPTVALTADEWEEVRHGRSLPGAWEEDAEVVGLIGPGGDLSALARCAEGRLRPFKVLAG